MPERKKHYKPDAKRLKHPVVMRINDEHKQFLDWIMGVDSAHGERTNMGKAIRECIEKLMELRNQ